MSNINKDYIEDYIRSVLPKRDSFLVQLEEFAQENNIPIIHPEVAEFMRVILKIKDSKNILEIGTAIGYSSIVMSNSIKEGNIITIERQENMVKLANENIEKSGIKNIEVKHGEAKDILPKLNKKFDFIFIDAAKGKYMEFLPYCINMLEDKGIILSDNVLFKGMVANDDLVVRRKKTIVRRMREYLDDISNHSELTTSIIPIGDGVALSYKESENR
ncbi:O-methyltransferase [Senegalia massiliensis]|uniref:tRNA 5-hydroxyuridine methyltransferase n=1 Tax=Senegalia massiliensis TaxID=1720316 RepID=A0A845QZT6_9CLOT|nr:O-methyltransferase [Senegalia massiliensis]NBI06708.1 O-methyltransferase [Senegalia massiliensis]